MTHPSQPQRKRPRRSLPSPSPPSSVTSQRRDPPPSVEEPVNLGHHDTIDELNSEYDQLPSVNELFSAGYALMPDRGPKTDEEVQEVFILTLNRANKNAAWKSALIHSESKLDSYSLDNQTKLKAAIIHAFETKHSTGSWDFSSLFKLLLSLRPPTKRSPQSPPRSLDIEEKKAVEESWKLPYLGNAPDRLWRAILARYTMSGYYARYMTIVQSSGMGKSRLVDELAKKHFVIPMNLRRQDFTGFPPPDNHVRDFLIAPTSHNQALFSVYAFLKALFTVTLKTLKAINVEKGNGKDVGGGGGGNSKNVGKGRSKNIGRGKSKKVKTVKGKDVLEEENVLALEFRSRMESGLQFDGNGGYREKFFEAVTTEAKCIFEESQRRSSDPNSIGVAEGCEKLTAYLRSGGHSESGPSVILLFDEAHSITETKTNNSTEPQWSVFTALRQALHKLIHTDCFSLFLSTTGTISQFTPSREEDFSARITSGSLRLIPPFSCLGFDHLAIKVSIDDSMTLEQVTSMKHITHLGRPMWATMYDNGTNTTQIGIIRFAADKLLAADSSKITELNKEHLFACLSARLPIEFYSTSYTSRLQEMKQVEGHMRVCLKVNAGFESMVTTTPSEPLLSLASHLIMRESPSSYLDALKSAFTGFSIHKGDRGEFLSMLLFTLARDQAVPDSGKSLIFSLTDFMENLFYRNSPNDNVEQLFSDLRRDFPVSFMHFLQFINFHAHALSIKFLVALTSRGAAVLCGKSQRGIDGVLTFLFKHSKLGLNNVGLLLWQARNDPHYGAKVQQHVFENMDPYRVGILEEGDAPIPIIKIVFALASRTPAFHYTKRSPSKSETGAYRAATYEIWCSGLSEEILSGVTESNKLTWNNLLKASYGWAATYSDDRACKTMNPGCAPDPEFWDHWLN